MKYRIEASVNGLELVIETRFGGLPLRRTYTPDRTGLRSLRVRVATLRGNGFTREMSK